VKTKRGRFDINSPTHPNWFCSLTVRSISSERRYHFIALHSLWKSNGSYLSTHVTTTAQNEISSD